jgi:peptidoglycan/xylan/chitin deacetylase (PgdA/CDA1 family)
MAAQDQPPRRGQAPPSRAGRIAGRVLALGSLVAVIVVGLVIVLGSRKTKTSSTATTTSVTQTSGSTQRTTTTPANKPAAVPILTYNVINTQPSGSTLPASLYVPVSEFTAQMQALKSAGWHAVTLDELASYWSGRRERFVAKPIVITFDGGYASQFNNALPVLKQMGWVGVLDVPVNLLPSSEGGLSTSQVQALKAAGWEIDAMSPTQPDLTTVDASTAQQQLSSARQSLSTTYNASVNWLAYSLGKYNATVAGAARAAGFSGAMTGAAGWANPSGNRFTLARVVVAGGTSPSQLQSQIASDQHSGAPPSSSNG